MKQTKQLLQQKTVTTLPLTDVCERLCFFLDKSWCMDTDRRIPRSQEIVH